MARFDIGDKLRLESRTHWIFEVILVTDSYYVCRNRLLPDNSKFKDSKLKTSVVDAHYELWTEEGAHGP